MDEENELGPIVKIHDEFKEAIEGTDGKSIPGDELKATSSRSGVVPVKKL